MQIMNPAPYIPPHAVAFSGDGGSAQLVGHASPLPVSAVAPTTTPLTGQAEATGTFGPYYPISGRSVILSLWGNWSGTVQVMRSTDGGATLLPLTVGGSTWALFTANCCESVWDESEPGATLFIKAMLTSGALNYRLAQ